MSLNAEALAFAAHFDIDDEEDFLASPPMAPMFKIAHFMESSAAQYELSDSATPSMVGTLSRSTSFTSCEDSSSVCTYEGNTLSILEALAITEDVSSRREVVTLKSVGIDLKKLDLQDRETLTSVTTHIAGFDSLAGYDAPRFLPILEARGGTDKDPASGHRRDSIPIAEAITKLDSTMSAIYQYLEEDGGLNKNAVRVNDAIRRHLKKRAHGVIVRVNPGTLCTATQAKLDAMLCELGDAGLKIMSHPDVHRKMGAKDALVKINHLKCGLPDTAVFYDEYSFSDGFRKSIAFRPRVIKQNRGSQGEGIWICKLKDESAYCAKYGDAIASMDTELVLVEANDNHMEYHTVAEFLEFCINGRTEASGEWTSKGKGCYLDGGLAAGAMLVDQRFLPRIVEGEVRCLMIGPQLVQIVHKKPKPGGLSATLQSGATYTKYEPDHPRFSRLVSNFQSDLPKIMSGFGLTDQPLPLLWTADYIYGDADDELYVGEFNCSCVGITQQLDQATLVGQVAVDAVFSPADERRNDAF